MGAEVNLRQDKKRKRIKIGGIFFILWAIPLVVFLITLLSEDNDYIDVPDIPGKMIGGSIAYDGRYYWATRIEISFGAAIKKEIVQFGPSGDVYHIFTPTQDFCGIAYDGERLWTADAAGSADYLSDDGNFYIIDQESGQFIEKFAIHRDYLLDGLTAGAGKLWVLGRYSEQQDRVFIWAVDYHIRSITHEVEVSKNSMMCCSGIAFLDGYIWAVLGPAGDEVVKISAHDGRIVQRYGLSETEINGIASDGHRILIVDRLTHQLYTLKGTERD